MDRLQVYRLFKFYGSSNFQYAALICSKLFIPTAYEERL